jgi:hypothetical protein
VSGLAAGGGRVTAIEEFTEFAVGAAPRLRRTAFPLCGDWDTAEDLTQTTLARMFVSWRRISRQDAVYADASRTLVNAYLAGRRRRRGREVLTGWLPETAAEPQACEVRMAVLDALATLPPRARVVVVMEIDAVVLAQRDLARVPVLAGESIWAHRVDAARVKAGLIRKAAGLCDDPGELRYAVCARDEVEHADMEILAVTAADIFGP